MVRQASINLAQQVIQQTESLEYLCIFTNTPKPKSAKKNGKSDDKVDFTPLKTKPLKSILKDLLTMSHEIVTDRT